MNDDRDLLEQAAKAVGYTLKWGEVFLVGGDEVDCTDLSYVVSGQPDEADWHWNPLADDGDALRLAAKLHLWEAVRLAHREVSDTVDIYAATRRAIVRAAAEIGRNMT